MKKEMDLSSSITDSFSIGHENSDTPTTPGEVLQTSSLVSITLDSSLNDSLPRELAGVDNFQTMEPQTASKSTEHEKMDADCNCVIFALPIQVVITILATGFGIVSFIKDNVSWKITYAVSAGIQIQLLIAIVIIWTCYQNRANKGPVIAGIFNLSFIGICELALAGYVAIVDTANLNSCGAEGCTYLHGPLYHRIMVIVVHVIYAFLHGIFVLLFIYEALKPPKKAVPRRKAIIPEAPKVVTIEPPKKSTQNDGDTSKSTDGFYAQPPRYPTMTTEVSTSARSLNQSGIDSSRNASCCLSQPPSIVESSVATKDSRGALIFNVPKTQQPHGFVNIQRVVVRLPPLKPSESASVPPSLRDSSTVSVEPSASKEMVYHDTVTPVK